ARFAVRELGNDAWDHRYTEFVKDVGDPVGGGGSQAGHAEHHFFELPDARVTIERRESVGVEDASQFGQLLEQDQYDVFAPFTAVVPAALMTLLVRHRAADLLDEQFVGWVERLTDPVT